MDEEVITDSLPVAELVVTATPEPVVDLPEEKPVEAPKTFTQEELDAAMGKRLAREQRKWERTFYGSAAGSYVKRHPCIHF